MWLICVSSGGTFTKYTVSFRTSSAFWRRAARSFCDAYQRCRAVSLSIYVTMSQCQSQLYFVVFTSTVAEQAVQCPWVKILTTANIGLIWHILSGISPPYLDDDCRLVADAREWRLPSTASWTCVVTRTYSTFGDRAFGAAGPGLWNSIPSHLKGADISYSEFRRSLLAKDISV